MVFRVINIGNLRLTEAITGSQIRSSVSDEIAKIQLLVPASYSALITTIGNIWSEYLTG